MKIVVNDKCVFETKINIDEEIMGVDGSDQLYTSIQEAGDYVVDAYVNANPALLKECLGIIKEFEKEKNVDWVHKRILTDEERKEIDKILIEKSAKYIKIYDDFGKLDMSNMGYIYYKLFE